MLDTLRAGAKSWISKVLIALLVLSFALWGISGDLLNVGGDQVATVGEQKVTIAAFDTAYRRELDRVGRTIGRPLSTSEGAALGLPQQVLGRLVAEAALNETAQDMNLGLSDEELVRQIQSSPIFQAPGGGFDRALLARVLQANGLTEDAFIAEQRLLQERLQIAEAIGGGVATPQPMLEAFNQHAKEARTLDYVVLDAARAGEIPAPDADTLTAYFEENQASFRAPEYRRVALLKVTPETVARPDEVSAEEIQREYDASGERFGEPESRRALQMTLTSEEDEAAVRQALAEGQSFEDILAARDLTVADVDLGFLTREDFIDPAIGDTVYALEEGAVSEIVEGRFSPVLIKVEEVRPARKTPLDEVADDLRTEIAERLAEREVLDLFDEIEDARAAGATVPEVAGRFNLPLETPPAFDMGGRGTDGDPVDLPEVDDLISDVFESDVGIEADPLQLGRSGFVWFEVAEVIPARDRTLDEVREDVIAAWTQDRRDARLSELAEETLQALESGTALADLAEENGLTVETQTGVLRSTQSDTLPAEAVAGAFSGPVGTTGSAARADGARIVYRVTDATAPAFFAEDAEVAALGERLSGALENSIIGQYVAERETALGVSVNQANISRVLGLNGR
ncbi:SurA N-terminal domain-containing protein [Stappia sp.]|uniref:peptidylprolyl isomerase n=1 Tax=Stappia sp. TaxID=1870903 RepID=UPI0032D8D901